MSAARWLAQLPRRCRSRSVDAALVTGRRLVQERMILSILGTDERPHSCKQVCSKESSPNMFQWATEFWICHGWDPFARKRGRGVQMGTERLARMTWADDNVLIAASTAQLWEVWAETKRLL